MLEFHPVKQSRASPARVAELLTEFKGVLLERGMASMDEYGDMLQWGLPRANGAWRKFHVFHPGWCSFDDRYWGTIHYHAGWIRGTILAGALEHDTYRAEARADGERYHEGQAYRLTKHVDHHTEGTSYELPAMVPHWIVPKALTITYFEEEDNGRLGDLINPASEETEDHAWSQADADALLPETLKLIDARLATLTRASTASARAS